MCKSFKCPILSRVRSKNKKEAVLSGIISGWGGVDVGRFVAKIVGDVSIFLYIYGVKAGRYGVGKSNPS